MGNAGRNGGEYYTPRALIRAMMQVVHPQIGECIYDGACGSAGFLCEAHDYLSAKPGLKTADLQTRTFYGKEKKKLLQENCNLHTVLDCPGRNMGKTNLLNDADLAEFVALQSTFSDSAKSWSVDVESVDATTFDLSVKNPTVGEVVAHRSPQAIMDEIAALDAEAASVLASIRELF
jgi:type I restriction enzyme M protein